MSLCIITNSNKSIYSSSDQFIAINNNYSTQNFQGKQRSAPSRNYSFDMSDFNTTLRQFKIEGHSLRVAGYTNYWMIMYFDFTKNINDNIAYYQITNVVPANDLCIIYPANKNTEHDTFCWEYLTNTSITNAALVTLVIELFDENNNIITPTSFSGSYTVQSYSLS